MPDTLSIALRDCELRSRQPQMLRLAFGLACVERVRHLLEDQAVVRALDVLAAFVAGSASRESLELAATESAELANRHQGSNSLDGVGHAAVSASYAVANALAGKALQAADYAAYAAVYGNGGYSAVRDPDSFAPEKAWQIGRLHSVARELSGTRSDA